MELKTTQAANYVVPLCTTSMIVEGGLTWNAGWGEIKGEINLGVNEFHFESGRFHK